MARDAADGSQAKLKVDVNVLNACCATGQVRVFVGMGGPVTRPRRSARAAAAKNAVSWAVLQMSGGQKAPPTAAGRIGCAAVRPWGLGSIVALIADVARRGHQSVSEALQRAAASGKASVMGQDARPPPH